MDKKPQSESPYAYARLSTRLGQAGILDWMPAVHRYNGPRHSELSAIGGDGYVYARVIWDGEGAHPWLHHWSRAHCHQRGEWTQETPNRDGALPDPAATLAAAVRKLAALPDGPRPPADSALLSPHQGKCLELYECVLPPG